WISASKHFHQNYSPSPYIGPLINWLSDRLLGRHIANGPRHFATYGLGLGVDEPRKPEIHNLRYAFGRNHDIRWLDITMNNFVSVRVVKSASHLEGNVNRLFAGN